MKTLCLMLVISLFGCTQNPDNKRTPEYMIEPALRDYITAHDCRPEIIKRSEWNGILQVTSWKCSDGSVIGEE